MNKREDGIHMRKKPEWYHMIQRGNTDGADGARCALSGYGYCRYGLTPEEAEEVMGFGGEFACDADFTAYGADHAERMYIEAGRSQYRDEFFRYLSENGDEFYEVDW